MVAAISILLVFLGIRLLTHAEKGSERRHRELSRACPPPLVLPGEIVYTARQQPIHRTDIDRILKRRFPYYSGLAEQLQGIFLSRVAQFLNDKTFIIKDDEGFREMPVLTSAAAVQLTFGLDDYLFPFYRYVRIYPEPYIDPHTLRILAGNVQGNVISVAWNLFLSGYENSQDGTNVGLHEMSHALYIQKMVVEAEDAPDFCASFNSLMDVCHEAHLTEKGGSKDCYSSYADTNLQEFWAETVELFFEKGAVLQQQYPLVFNGMVQLLGQNPLYGTHPLIS